MLCNNKREVLQHLQLWTTSALQHVWHNPLQLETLLQAMQAVDI
jgi:hypothetical protein